MKEPYQYSEQERAWIRLMGNAYAGLSLWEPDDEEAMITPRKEQPTEKRPSEENSTDL